MWMEEVIAGMTIIGVRVKSPCVWLQVKGGGCLEIEVEPDCCSDAFIDAVAFGGNPTLTGKTTELDFPAPPTTQEVDTLTAVEFECDTGCLRILHRNSSNGYYGNYLRVTARGEPPEDAEDGRYWYRKVYEGDRNES